MIRQGLRSAASNTERVPEDLDRTLTETSENREEESNMDLGGQTTHRGEEFSEAMTRKLDELEKRVKKMFDDERKRREKLEAEKDKGLQKRLVTIEAGINRSLQAATGVTQALEERDSRIEIQFGRLEAQQTRIMERLNAEGERREEIRGLERGPNIKYILPEFRGDTSPIRYMNQIKQYWEAVKPRDSDTHYLIERSLTGPPGDWWQIIKDEVSNFQIFINKFLKRYWSEQTQHELRRKLEFGAHSEGTRTEYAIRLYAEAKELRPAMSSNEIIQKLARHYNEEIKYAIVGRGITRIEDLVEILENFDRIGPINRNTEREREWKRQEELKLHNRGNQPQAPPSWRAQQSGNHQDKMRHVQPTNVPSWQRNTQGNYGNPQDRNREQNNGRDAYRNNRPTENRSWRHNTQTAHQIRNMEVESESPQECMEEENIPSTESGNECQPRL